MVKNTSASNRPKENGFQENPKTLTNKSKNSSENDIVKETFGISSTSEKTTLKRSSEPSFGKSSVFQTVCKAFIILCQFHLELT